MVFLDDLDRLVLAGIAAGVLVFAVGFRLLSPLSLVLVSVGVGLLVSAGVGHRQDRKALAARDRWLARNPRQPPTWT